MAVSMLPPMRERENEEEKTRDERAGIREVRLVRENEEEKTRDERAGIREVRLVWWCVSHRSTQRESQQTNGLYVLQDLDRRQQLEKGGGGAARGGFRPYPG
ncbi:unnamed protein product [Boreogadus saida]